MQILENIIETFTELGTGIKDAAVEFGEDLFEIITEDIPDNIAEKGEEILDWAEDAGGKAMDKIEELGNQAIEIAASDTAKTIVTKIFKTIK